MEILKFALSTDGCTMSTRDSSTCREGDGGRGMEGGGGGMEGGGWREGGGMEGGGEYSDLGSSLTHKLVSSPTISMPLLSFSL